MVTHNRIKELRNKKGLSQKEFAKAFGDFTKNDKNIKSVSYATISRWERGENEPNLETWIRLADFFDVPVPYLQGVSDEITPNFENNKYSVFSANLSTFKNFINADSELKESDFDTKTKLAVGDLIDNYRNLISIILSPNLKKSEIPSRISLFKNMSKFIDILNKEISKPFNKSKFKHELPSSETMSDNYLLVAEKIIILSALMDSKTINKKAKELLKEDHDKNNK